MMLLPVAVFAGFAALAGWALMRDDPDALPSAMVGREAPSVGETTLPDKVQLTDGMLRQPGVKLVNFWASWCPPCRAEHPTLTELSARLPVRTRRSVPCAGHRSARAGGDRLGRDRAARDLHHRGSGRMLYRHAGPLVREDYTNRFLPELEKALAAE